MNIMNIYKCSNDTVSVQFTRSDRIDRNEKAATFRRSGHIHRHIIMYKVELLNSSTITELGEAPHWDADTQSLYFLDVLGSGRGAQIFRYDYAEQRQYSATIGE